jgi:hypothetical protein
LLHFHHLVLGLADEVADCVDTRPLEAVKAPHGQVKFLNSHLEDLFLALVVLLHHYLRRLRLAAQADEKVEMLIEDLGADRDRFLGGYGRVGPDLEA